MSMCLTVAHQTSFIFGDPPCDHGWSHSARRRSAETSLLFFSVLLLLAHLTVFLSSPVGQL